MKNVVKRILALILVTSMMVTAAGCGKGKGANGDNTKTNNEKVKAPDYLNTGSALPIVKDGTDITLKVMIQEGAYYEDMDSIKDVYFVNAYEKKTNVKIEWIEVPKDSFDDKLALMLSTGELPDVIIKGGISNSNQLKYGDQGYFLNLMDNDLLKTYAPSYWALCQKYPEVLSASMMPDGKVYSLGLVRNSVGSVVASKLYFNQDWMNKLGMKVPTTSKEFQDLLYAFKNNDPNGNGRADEAGLYTSPSILENVTFGMFGLGNRGIPNGYIDADKSTGKARYFPATEGYKQWLQYVINLYKTGLLNKEYFDFTEAKLGTYVMNNTVGAFAYTNLSMVDKKNQAKMTYLGGALTGPNGDKDWYGTNSIGSTGSYIITTSCKYPEVALRWADYLYSDEGSLFFYYGDPGVTCVKNADGTYSYSDKVLADFYSGKNSYDGCAAYVSLYGYGNTPSKTQVPFNSADDNNGIALLSANKLIKDCPIAWPSFTFTRTEQRVIEDTKGDIDSYVKSARDSWIMGTTPLNDTTWNEFVQTIKKMGIDDVLNVYNAALERAKKNGFKEGYHTPDEFK